MHEIAITAIINRFLYVRHTLSNCVRANQAVHACRLTIMGMKYSQGAGGGRFSSLFFLNGQMIGPNVVKRYEAKRVYARKGNAEIVYEEWVKQNTDGGS